MAVVYRARQIDLDREVALKELSAAHAEDPEWASRFLRESRLVGSLTHANIVTVHDYFECGGKPFIAMEYLERGSLRPYVGVLELAQIGGVLADVLAGLQHAERRGIVHRDLKPENLLVTDEGQVKIADFGIAKASSEASVASFKTEAGVAVGTPGYMAPEQALASGIGPWTDLYSLGCMAYEMSAGTRPFPGVTEPFALMLRHINEPIPSAREVDPHVDPEFSAWIDTLLVKAPADRVQSAAAAWEALDELLCARVGPRWRRDSALPDIVPARTAPVAPLQSAFLDTTRLTQPAAVPGPYTPPPASAVVSAELAALDPDTRHDAPVASSGAAQPRRRRRAALTLAGGTLAVAASVAAVVLLGGGGEPAAAPADKSAPDQTLSAGPLSITAPGDWDVRRDATAPAGLELDEAAGVTPPGGGAVTLGMAPAATTTHALLPPDLLAEGGEAPERTEVGLGDARAFRYDALPGGLRAFVVPTEDGVATIACEPPVTDACDQIASTLKVPEVVPLGPDQDLAAEVREGMTDIDDAVRSTDLRDARATRAQALSRDADIIRVPFARFASRLERFDARPADLRLAAALQRAVSAEATAYQRLGNAARRSDRGGYRRAALAARRGQRELEAALDALTLAGYEPIDAPRAPSIGALEAPVAEPASTPAPTPVPTTAAPTPTATTSYLPAPVEPTPERRSNGPIDPGSGG